MLKRIYVTVERPSVRRSVCPVDCSRFSIVICRACDSSAANAGSITFAADVEGWTQTLPRCDNNRTWRCDAKDTGHITAVYAPIVGHILYISRIAAVCVFVRIIADYWADRTAAIYTFTRIKFCVLLILFVFNFLQNRKLCNRKAGLFYVAF